ncbi:hypothetical protein BS47DRAFT_98007 [Hydnum rufescens UP504]|uniref:Uncharacterized protein n=1 Tax=Hydnum rufescens UP504 TaxID=1448309 RepID=A0A9P6DT52_9AGAM|nr:hypothetical protein BS47DRAFT_98007 [Hydnum rufescens UP504]
MRTTNPNPSHLHLTIQCPPLPLPLLTPASRAHVPPSPSEQDMIYAHQENQEWLQRLLKALKPQNQNKHGPYSEPSKLKLHAF